MTVRNVLSVTVIDAHVEKEVHVIPFVRTNYAPRMEVDMRRGVKKGPHYIMVGIRLETCQRRDFKRSVGVRDDVSEVILPVVPRVGIGRREI